MPENVDSAASVAALVPGASGQTTGTSLVPTVVEGQHAVKVQDSKAFPTWDDHGEGARGVSLGDIVGPGAGLLVDAARANDFEKLRLAIEGLGTDVNQRDPKTGGTALHITALNGGALKSHDAVELLVQAKADVDARDYLYGATPLHCAAVSGDRTMCLQLASYGADSKATNKAGKTPGERAADAGYHGVAQMLYHMEAGVNFSTGMFPAGEVVERQWCKCVPQNGAKAVVCIEKWLLVGILLGLMGLALLAMFHGMSMETACDAYIQQPCTFNNLTEVPVYDIAAAEANGCTAGSTKCVYTATFSVSLIMNGLNAAPTATNGRINADLYKFAHQLVAGEQYLCYYRGPKGAEKVLIGDAADSIDCRFGEEVFIIGASCAGGTLFCILLAVWLMTCGPLATPPEKPPNNGKGKDGKGDKKDDKP